MSKIPKILTTTHVFPSSVMPNVGIFVQNRIHHMAKIAPVKVIAPAPYFPFAEKIRKNYKPAMPPFENIADIGVYHPRFFTIPKYGTSLNAFFFFTSVFPLAKKIKKTYPFEIIDAHFIHPDGIGAAMLGRVLNIPVVITLRGTLTRLSTVNWARPQIKWALQTADRIITVSSHLKDTATQLGVSEEKIDVIPNGVDTDVFFMENNKDDFRKTTGLPDSSKILISVGRIVEWKGYHRIMEAMPALLKKFPDLLYIIVGGPGTTKDYTPELIKKINQMGLQNHVRLVGEQNSVNVRKYLNASDLFCLATRGEGWSNVITEALACGIPVVATNVGGNPEIVNSDELGCLVSFGDKKELENTLYFALTKKWDRKKIAEKGSRYGWGDVAKNVMNTFDLVLKKRAGSSY